MKRSYTPVFAAGFQKAVLLLRKGGLLEKNQFPELIGRITAVVTLTRGRGNTAIETVRFLVKIGIRKNFEPDELWLKFNGRGNSVYVSPDLANWVCLNKFERL